jgi:carbon-monoxide dehydrogenase large subunit
MTADPSAPLIGQRLKRYEDPPLIRGQATFIDDIKLPGMLHMAFKRICARGENLSLWSPFRAFPILATGRNTV